MEKILILDWDGTLHNTSHLYGCAFRKAYQWLLDENHVDTNKYPADPEHYNDVYMERYLGMNSKDMWNTFMPELAQDIKDAASKRVGDGMVEQIKAHQAVLYPGALEVLKQFKKDGWKLIFLSNCKHAYMEAHREEFQLDDYYDAFYCCEDYNFAPKEEIWKDVAKDHPGFHVVVGDRASDLKIAKEHDLVSVGCHYGFGTLEEMELADQVAKNVKELPRLVNLMAPKGE